jgi:hypothetical protein
MVAGEDTQTSIRHLQNRNEEALARGKIGFDRGRKMSQLRDYIEKYPGESQRLVGLDYEQLMLVNQPSSKITQSEKTGSGAEKKKNYSGFRCYQVQ